MPVDNPVTGQAPKLFVVLEYGCEPDAENGYNEKAFRDFLAKALDANKQPKSVDIIDEIPQTFNGKIRRNRLME